MPAYAELQVTSNFSFLCGASHPEELIDQADILGLAAISVTDRNSFAGIVRAHQRAKQRGLRFVPGCRLDLADAPSLLCWPMSRPAYARLSDLLTTGKLRATKAHCMLSLADIEALTADLMVAIVPDGEPDEIVAGLARRLGRHWGDRVHLACSHRHAGDDEARIERLVGIARTTGIRPLATNDVHYHIPERRRLQDVVTCIREHLTLDEAGALLFANAERHLKPPAEMARLFRRWPEAIANGIELVERCRFSLDELAYDYPIRESYDGRTPDQELARRAWEGAEWRYPGHLPDKVRGALERELELIGQLRYAPYFLTVHDIVSFARAQDILCQGRGSAANSAVCFVLGVTSVDPSKMDLLFERFVSSERDEPPDIDVDFEHERREDVIQHVYDTYGRDHAGMTATVIRYRSKSALREVAKALGLSRDIQDALTATVWGFGREGFHLETMRAAGIEPEDPRIGLTLELAAALLDFPRHLSQHPGGFVIAKSPLRELVPIENAAMPGRTMVEWDKDDLDALRMLKIDLLALGMLTCIRRAFELLWRHYAIELDLARVPAEDPAVYRMLSEADSIGVFQVESRAQMSMLPRLRPACFYDLVIEVAIVRPGPIQGDMVHPYLRRREGKEPVEFPSSALEEVLGKTLGVPLFQEQAMKIAIVAAGFTPAEADGLRRSMAAFRRHGEVQRWEAKLVEGMVANGYERDFAERCFRQIEGFGYYGFPESHAASFALLVYVSAWLKCHYPDVFCAAILNAQPMGFYAPAQLVRDAVDHGTEAREADVNRSFWDNTLEPLPRRRGPLKTAVRLGFRQIKGFPESEANLIVTGRLQPYRTIEELKRRTGIERRTLVRLAEADAFRSLGLDRRQALWLVHALKDPLLPLFDHAMAGAPPGSNLPPIEPAEEPWLELPTMSLGEQVVEDYTSLRLSLKAHPVGLLRARLARRRIVTARQLWQIEPGRRVRIAGLVIVRQRPGSAKGVVFTTLEDETGFANVIVWSHVFERFRAIVMIARFLGVTGQVQREGRVIHVVAEQLVDLTPELQLLRAASFDPRIVDGLMSRADEVNKGIPEIGPGPAARPDPTVGDAIPAGRNFR